MATEVEYLVKERSLIYNTLYEAGQTAKYDGLPADNLEPTCDEGRARAAEFAKSNAERVKTMIAANTDSGIGDVQGFMAQFRAELLQSQSEMAAAISEGIASALASAQPAGKPKKAADAPAADAEQAAA